MTKKKIGDDIKMDLRLWGWEVDGNGSELSRMPDFGISRTETLRSEGHALAVVVSCQHLIAEALFSPCDLRWTKWHWDRIFSEFFSSPCQYSTEAPYSYIIWGMNNRLLGDCSSETYSHPTNMKNMKKMSERELIS
jgi:hypothetical protein